jgi:hypothetical protein
VRSCPWPPSRACAQKLLWRTAAGFASVVLSSVVLGYWYLSASSTCPGNARADWTRALGTLALLATTAEGRAQLVKLRERPVLCFGPVHDGVLQAPRVLILAEARSARLNASRMAHLLVHELDGAPLDELAARSGALSCDELTERAMRREAAAYATESRVGQALGVTVASVPPVELAREYRARCQSLRRRGE